MKKRFSYFRFLPVTAALFFIAALFSQISAEVESAGGAADLHGLSVAQNESQPSSEPPQAPSAPPKGDPPPPPKDAPPRERMGTGPRRHTPRHEHKQIHRGDEMEVLDRLLTMPSEKLARIRRALERIEAMTPEERENFRQRLLEFREFSPEKRKEMREEWRKMSPEERREYIEEMRERPWNKVLEENPEQESQDSTEQDSEKSPD